MVKWLNFVLKKPLIFPVLCFLSPHLSPHHFFYEIRCAGSRAMGGCVLRRYENVSGGETAGIWGPRKPMRATILQKPKNILAAPEDAPSLQSLSNLAPTSSPSPATSQLFGRIFAWRCIGSLHKVNWPVSNVIVRSPNSLVECVIDIIIRQCVCPLSDIYKLSTQWLSTIQLCGRENEQCNYLNKRCNRPNAPQRPTWQYAPYPTPWQCSNIVTRQHNHLLGNVLLSHLAP